MAKDAFSSASEKTSGLIYDQKCNIKLAKVCSELKKAYERLGRLCYRKLKGLKIDDNEFDAAVERVEALKIQLAELREGKAIGSTDMQSIVFEDGEQVTNE
jgi:hypothetical protein